MKKLIILFLTCALFSFSAFSQGIWAGENGGQLGLPNFDYRDVIQCAATLEDRIDVSSQDNANDNYLEQFCYDYLITDSGYNVIQNIMSCVVNHIPAATYGKIPLVVNHNYYNPNYLFFDSARNTNRYYSGSSLLHWCWSEYPKYFSDSAEGEEFQPIAQGYIDMTAADTPQYVTDFGNYLINTVITESPIVNTDNAANTFVITVTNITNSDEVTELAPTQPQSIHTTVVVTTEPTTTSQPVVDLNPQQRR